MQRAFLRWKAGFYEFWITDTGIGMQKEFVKNKLFQPFTQEQADARTQYKGKRSWHVDCQGPDRKYERFYSGGKRAGEGTTFTFQLPFLLDDTTCSNRKRRRRKRLMQPE